jgi:Autographiviridae endonuclease VII
MAYTDPEAKRANRRTYYLANKEKILAYNKEYHKSHKEEIKATRNRPDAKWRQKANLKRKYGMTPEEFDQRREDQNNRCGMCRDPFTKTPHVDHNHTTGRVRALLCTNCNSALGHLKESPTRCLAALAYLEAWN